MSIANTYSLVNEPDEEHDTECASSKKDGSTNGASYEGEKIE